MDKDLVDGTGKRVSGSVKEAIGKVTGDTKLEADGIAQKTAGQVQNAAGRVKDGLRDSVHK